MTDIELIDGLVAGDEISYKFMFENYYEWLCNYLYKLNRNYALSEDIVQDVFIKLWENKENIKINSSVKNYLFKSCHNQFLQHVRKEKTKIDFLDSLRQDVLYEMYDQDSLVDEKVLKLNQAINGLPPRCKDVFIQSKIEKKKYKEIAEDMNISIKTVENQISKALRFIRKTSLFFLT